MRFSSALALLLMTYNISPAMGKSETSPLALSPLVGCTDQRAQNDTCEWHCFQKPITVSNYAAIFGSRTDPTEIVSKNTKLVITKDARIEFQDGEYPQAAIYAGQGFPDSNKYLYKNKTSAMQGNEPTKHSAMMRSIAKDAHDDAHKMHYDVKRSAVEKLAEVLRTLRETQSTPQLPPSDWHDPLEKEHLSLVDHTTVQVLGHVSSLNRNNAGAIRVVGLFADILLDGTLHISGGNVPGIEVEAGFGTKITMTKNAKIISDNKGTQPISKYGASGHTQLGNNEGISSVGISTSITAAGSFRSTTSNSEWISSSGADVSVVVHEGSFESTGSNSEGVSIDSLGGNVELHGGKWRSSGSNSELLSVSGIGIKALVKGVDFESKGNQSEGISITGSKNQLESHGPIVTHGEESEGISLSGPSTILHRWGIDGIETFGENSEGISCEGSHSEVNVLSSIETHGLDSEGISAQGKTEVTVLLGGDITTHGLNSEGISCTAVTKCSVTLMGNSTLTTHGVGSEGISIMSKKSGSVTLEDGASITTQGRLSPGIAIVGDGTTVTLHGSVSADLSSALFVFGDSNKIVIESTGSIASSVEAVKITGHRNTIVVRGNVTGDIVAKEGNQNIVLMEATGNIAGKVIGANVVPVGNECKAQTVL